MTAGILIFSYIMWYALAVVLTLLLCVLMYVTRARKTRNHTRERFDDPERAYDDASADAPGAPDIDTLEALQRTVAGDVASALPSEQPPVSTRNVEEALKREFELSDADNALFSRSKYASMQDRRAQHAQRDRGNNAGVRAHTRLLREELDNNRVDWWEVDQATADDTGVARDAQSSDARESKFDPLMLDTEPVRVPEVAPSEVASEKRSEDDAALMVSANSLMKKIQSRLNDK